MALLFMYKCNNLTTLTRLSGILIVTVLNKIITFKIHRNNLHHLNTGTKYITERNIY